MQQTNNKTKKKPLAVQDSPLKCINPIHTTSLKIHSNPFNKGGTCFMYNYPTLIANVSYNFTFFPPHNSALDSMLS